VSRGSFTGCTPNLLPSQAFFAPRAAAEGPAAISKDREAGLVRPCGKGCGRCFRACFPAPHGAVPQAKADDRRHVIRAAPKNYFGEPPAPGVRVDRKVSRRGTCDRGIWTKSLAFAADAEELIFLYGFSMPVSPFDRLGSSRSRIVAGGGLAR
jgi:hypothetical protein